MRPARTSCGPGSGCRRWRMASSASSVPRTARSAGSFARCMPRTLCWVATTVPPRPKRARSDMGWLQKLIETYDVCAGAAQFAANPLSPISHTPQQAHIEIVIDEHGTFRRARILQKEEALIPATEESAGRTGTKPPPHPLCDKIQYVAADYPTHGGAKPSFHAEYLALLGAWCASPFADPKAQVVLSYVKRCS